MASRERRVARKPHTCFSCETSIERGDTYDVVVDLPGRGAVYANEEGQPVRVAECLRCAAEHDWDLS